MIKRKPLELSPASQIFRGPAAFHAEKDAVKADLAPADGFNPSASYPQMGPTFPHWVPSPWTVFQSIGVPASIAYSPRRHGAGF
jgi:hypothetical protein